MSVIKKSQIKEQLNWSKTLIKMLRGKRTPKEFAELLGISEEKVLRWEARRATPDAEEARRLRKVASDEHFLEDWQLAGSMTLVDDLEEASRELTEAFKKSLERTEHLLNE